jgi:protein SCO1
MRSSSPPEELAAASSVRRKPSMLLRVLIAATVAMSAAIIALLLAIPRSATTPALALEGTNLHSIQAPNFRLTDQFRHSVSLSQFRGRVVILAFFYTRCADVCPLTAEKLRDVARGLGRERSSVAVLAVTTDPRHDTPAAARRFLIQHGNLRDWHFLLGKPYDVAQVWTDYHVYSGPSESTAGGAQSTHTAGMYVIDRQGHERAYLDDVVPASEIASDIHILLGDRWGISALPPAPEVGAAAPDFTLPMLDGGSVRLRGLRGKAVLVNFWATWCIPCRTELARLEQAYRQLGPRGLVVVAIDREEDAHTISNFSVVRHVSFPIAMDRDGSVGYEYNLFGTPTSFLIDRNGVIRYVHAGPISAASLARESQALLSH